MTTGAPGSLLGCFVGIGRLLRSATSNFPRSSRTIWTGPLNPRPAPTARHPIIPSSSEPSVLLTPLTSQKSRPRWPASGSVSMWTCAQMFTQVPLGPRFPYSITECIHPNPFARCVLHWQVPSMSLCCDDQSSREPCASLWTQFFSQAFQSLYSRSWLGGWLHFNCLKTTAMHLSHSQTSVVENWFTCLLQHFDTYASLMFSMTFICLSCHIYFLIYFNMIYGTS